MLCGTHFATMKLEFFSWQNENYLTAGFCSFEIYLYLAIEIIYLINTKNALPIDKILLLNN